MRFLFWGKKEVVCEHQFTAFLDENNCQFCIHCGMARRVENNCEHKWERIEGEPNRLICEECGDIKNIDCSHHWEKIGDDITCTGSYDYGKYYKYRYECSICGGMKMENSKD